MGYRDDWFKTHKSIRGKYKCVRCGKLYRKNEIEIDHRIPKRDGGTDDLWNLQPMCIHCNRSKRDNQTSRETAETLLRATVNGGLGKALGSIAKQKVKDAVGIKYKRK